MASPCIVFDRISKIHIFGTKLQSCLETHYIKSRSSSAMTISVWQNKGQDGIKYPSYQ
nr:MAG TPA: hypothetical protein [Caudoviricetes sp.]